MSVFLAELLGAPGGGHALAERHALLVAGGALGLGGEAERDERRRGNADSRGSNGISKIAQWSPMRIRWPLPLTNERKRT